MPSYLHELLVNLFRNRADTTTVLLRDLDVPLPEHDEIQPESTSINDLKLAEYRADLVLFLVQRSQKVLGVIVEIQLRRDDDKHYSWPAYVANLHARHRCPICLLVITVEQAISRWAEKTIELGPGSYCRPCVVGPANTPAITALTDAERNVELAVLSAVAHGKDSDKALAERVARAATAACRSIDKERSNLYLDLIDVSLKHSAPEVLEAAMNSLGYEYQGDFARRYVAEGRTEGLIEGRTGTILRLLARRFGILTEADQARIRGAEDAVLDKVENAMMLATTLDEILELLK